MKKVLTVGVYDMLHIGHILLFKRAKELGDYLMVAVQADEVIFKYIPEAKMVYTTAERMFCRFYQVCGRSDCLQRC